MLIKQLYGTQFKGDAHGNYTPFPIEDPQHLAVRRRKVGLGSFAEYQKKMMGL